MQQAAPTENTLRAAIKLLNYAATHPDACVQYRASDMVLHIHSDASYLSETEARSAVAGFLFCNGQPKSSTAPDPIHLNGPILAMFLARSAVQL